MSFWDKITTKHSFQDGAKLSVLHKYSLRFETDGRVVDIGFEQALEPGVDRLIHEESIRWWVLPRGKVRVMPEERAAIIDRVQQYCVAKGLTYRIVP